MTDTNIFALAQVIKAAGNDPSAVVDAVWAAGYRQPERSAEEAAKITIDTFYYCESFGMPTDFWPKTYDDVLQNEMMESVLAEDADHLFNVEPVKAAKSILAAGFSLEHRADENAGEPEKYGCGHMTIPSRGGMQEEKP